MPCIAACLLVFAACSKPHQSTPQTAPDPVAQLRALAANLDKPLKDKEVSHVRVDVRKSDSLVSPLVGEISGECYIAEHDPSTNFNWDKVAYFKEFTIFADYLDGEWIYAGAKSRSRKVNTLDWFEFTDHRDELRGNCGFLLEAIGMKHDKDAM
jgi:hypothetical protein